MSRIRSALQAIRDTFTAATCRHRYTPRYSYPSKGRIITVSRCGRCNIHREEVTVMEEESKFQGSDGFCPHRQVFAHSVK